MRPIDGDYISDALEAELCREGDDLEDRQWAYGYAAGVSFAVRKLAEAPTLTLPNEWVSADERLPENHAQVLMWSAKWNIAEAGSYYNGRFWVYSEIGDAYIADDITHWMLLPAPPAKGGDR